MARPGRLGTAIGFALLVCAAIGILLWVPWHGPTILSLSSTHGVDTGDLPALLLLAVAVGLGRGWARDGRAWPMWLAGRWAGVAATLAVGALLLLTGIVETSQGEPLMPAGGGTFGGTTLHADARRGEPVNRWSHVTATYDGAVVRLYVNGTEVSRRATTGNIRRTSDPLWIGGSRPYGEYFEGLIDEVRVYDRALSRSEVRTEMSTPVASARTSSVADLAGAYSFDDGSRTVAADASGKGNAGSITGATWTAPGRFGGALRFDGSGEVVRVPASPSLDLTRAMTLSAWVRPSQSQAGWRTVLHRQTDAYFLMAGGGRPNGGGGALDNMRAVLLLGAAVWLCAVLASGRVRWIDGPRRSWWAPVALFLAGSVVDAALMPSIALIGPTLVAIWYAVTASHRGEAASMYLVAAALTGLTVLSFASQGGHELPQHNGGDVRSAAIGLLLVTAGVLGAHRCSSGRAQALPDTAALRF